MNNLPTATFAYTHQVAIADGTLFANFVQGRRTGASAKFASELVAFTLPPNP